MKPASPPPAAEAIALWNRATPANEDPEVTAMLDRRGVDPYLVADRDLMRALPERGALPEWATVGGLRWDQSRHRGLVPTFEALGGHQSLRARSTVQDAEPKEVAPAGHSATGLVMADAGARQMLETGALFGPLWVAEGTIDFLVAATTWSDSSDVAVLGIMSGSWTPELAARIPDQAHVVIATDDDETGDKYAARIVESLLGRVSLERWHPEVA
jgi:hypothetical protein